MANIIEDYKRLYREEGSRFTWLFIGGLAPWIVITVVNLILILWAA